MFLKVTLYPTWHIAMFHSTPDSVNVIFECKSEH